MDPEFTIIELHASKMTYDAGTMTAVYTCRKGHDEVLTLVSVTFYPNDFMGEQDVDERA